MKNKEAAQHSKIPFQLLSRSPTAGYTDPAKKTQGKCKSERVKKEIYLLVQKNLIFRRSMRMPLKNRKGSGGQLGGEGRNTPAKHKGRGNIGIN